MAGQDRLIIDMHCHAWRQWPYRPLVPDELTRGTVDQLLYQMDRHGVSAAVVVCAAIGHNPDNVEYVSSAAERHPGRLHVLADLDSTWSAHYHQPGIIGRLRDLLEQHQLVGITHYMGEHNDGWLRSEDAERLFALAEQEGLLLSLSTGAAWYDDLAALARAHPGAAVLCHHLGGLRPGWQQRDELKDLVKLVRSTDNIVFKVSGYYYLTERTWAFPWNDVSPVVEQLIEAAGVDRLCWGSDFPVATGFCTYTQALELVRSCCDGLSASDLDAVLGGTAARLLRRRNPNLSNMSEGAVTEP